MAQLWKLLNKVQLTFLLYFGLCVVALALTPPGTVILNRASVIYEILSKDEPQESVSNATTVAVGNFFAFTVQNIHALNVAAGVVARFPHRIVNQGNTGDSYKFVFNAGAPPFSVGVFDKPIVFHDINSNGHVEADEPVIEETALLSPGETIDVVVTARVSAALQEGQQEEFPFSVESVSSDTTQTVINRVTVGSPGELAITLDTDQSCGVPLFPGDRLTHSVAVSNAGFGVVDGTTYVIDGNLQEGIIVELPVSPNLSFTGLDANSTSGTIPGLALVQLESFNSNEWISASAVSPNEPVTAVGYYFLADLLITGEVAAFDAQFSVKGNVQVPTSILTTAIYDADADGIADVVSNSTCNTFSTVVTALDTSELRFIQSASSLLNAGGIPDFFTETDFTDAERYQLMRSDTELYVAPRDGVYLEFALQNSTHPAIRTDSVGNRYVISEVESTITGDRVNVVLLQTLNPDIFRSIAPLVLSTDSRADGATCPVLDSASGFVPLIDQFNPDCVLQSSDNDELQARLGTLESGLVVASVAAVNQQSVVFDSRTFEPVSGATIEIRLADTGALAVDGVTGADFSFVSDRDGRYSLPRLDDDTGYYLQVVPPETHQFPSEQPPSRLTDFRVHGFSYGRNGIDNTERSGVFFGASINSQGSIDIPLDPRAVAMLLSVDKAALRTTVDIGQAVFYRIAIRNAVGELSDVVATDTLPFGFRFVPGSVLIDGEQGTDPDVSGNNLEFRLGDLAESQLLELTYAARPAAAAIDGNGVNTIAVTGMSIGGRIIESLPATARVRVNRTGVFSDRAALFGKIYVDQNCDGIHNDDEWPIGGVRVYLQDGTFAITDADGLYSLYGLAPDQYVVQVDTHSLPKGLELKLLSVEQLDDADSRLIRLSDGDFHRADFAAGCPVSNAKEIFAELERRNKSIDGSWSLQHAERLNNRQLQGGIFTDNSRRSLASGNGDLSRGFIDSPEGFDAGSGSGSIDLSDAEIGRVDSSSAEATEQQRIEKQRELDAKKVVATITKEQAKEGTWLWPQNDMSLNGRFMVVIRSGLDPTLYVNGEPVASSHIGERIENRREKAQVVVWYGVELESGENTVEVKATGPFGNERILATGLFKRPSVGTRIVLDAQSLVVPADSGRSTLPVAISILDENGYPALGVYYINLESSDGHWLEPDIQDKEPGHQIRVENGQRTIYYRTSGTPGEVSVKASTGNFSDQLLINQVVESRPLLVSGFIEAGGYFAVDEIGDFSASTDLGQLDETARFDTRAALFVKGTVKDNYNLTLSYDSKSSNSRDLLRDINPTLHYPVHGDASIRGFEAQSRSKLYLRVERDNSSLTWGDYVTDSDADQRDLARQSRTLTGINAVYDDDRSRLRVFAASEENRNIVEEIRGNGSALQFRLRQFPIVPNSETVELITRSRDNPDLILESVRLSQAGDYHLDDELGFLSFASSISALDVDQNPVFIRVSYSVEQGGDDYLIAGVRFDRSVGEKLTLGASFTRDEHAEEGRNLIGIYGSYDISKQTRLSLSLAHSDSIQTGVGNAHSLSFDHEWSQKNAASTSITHQWADKQFSNAGSSVSAGRTETSLTHTQNINDKTRLLLEARQSRLSSGTVDERLVAGAALETSIKEWRARAGLRQIKQESADETDSFTTLLLGGSRKFNFRGKPGQADIELEQDLGRLSRTRVSAGTKLALHDDVDGYARYEITNNLLSIASLSGDLVTESFTVGVESDALPSTRLYSEYRMRDAFESKDFESATGVKGDYEIQKGLRVSPGFEYIERIGGLDGDSLSFSIGFVDTRNQSSRRLIRLESRLSSETDHYGLRASVTSRLNDDWTGLISGNVSFQDNRDSEDVLRNSIITGFARRPKYENKHHMLFTYRLEQEREVSNGIDRTVHVASTHQNLQIDKDTILSGRIGLKHDTSTFSFNRISDFALLADARLSFDLSRRLNVDTGLGALTTDGTSEVRYSLGVGLNYILKRNLQLSFAYNLIGFRDDELDAQEYNVQGAHIGLRYKLDEELFKWLE